MKKFIQVGFISLLLGSFLSFQTFADVVTENPAYNQQLSLAWIGVSIASVLTLFFVLRLKNRQIPLKNLFKMPFFYLNLVILAVSLSLLTILPKKEIYEGPARQDILPPADSTASDTNSIKI